MTRAECCATRLHKHFAGCMLAKKLKLHEDTRWQIAGEAIEELRRYSGWAALDEAAPIKHPAPRLSKPPCDKDATRR